MFRAPLIALEGLDGVGKSTLCQRIYEHLSETNNELQDLLYVPEVIRLPRRQTETGQILDKYLKRELDLDPLIAHYLFAANRWEVKDYIETLLNTQHPVILDRYVASGTAYSAAKGRLTFNFCNKFHVGLPRPDLTIYLENKAPHFERNYRPRERYETKVFQYKVGRVFDLLKCQDNWITISVDETNDQNQAKVNVAATQKIDELIETFQKTPIPIRYF
jgi:dTMP kinase